MLLGRADTIGAPSNDIDQENNAWNYFQRAPKCQKAIWGISTLLGTS